MLENQRGLDSYPTSSVYFLGLGFLAGFSFCLFALKDDKELAESRAGRVTGTQWGLDKELHFLFLRPSFSPSLPKRLQACKDIEDQPWPQQNSGGL